VVGAIRRQAQLVRRLAYFEGSRSSQTRGCSITWSSTEMILASSGSM
jgi:hypothetical protein